MLNGKTARIKNVYLFLIVCLCPYADFFNFSKLYSDVQSSTGQIVFDVNNDGTAEANLTTTGLGIGTLTPSANLSVTGNTVISDSLGVGVSQINHTLHINGTIGFSVQTISSNTTLSANSFNLVDTSSANVTIQVPPASDYDGRQYTIKKISTSNELTISGGPFDNEDYLVLSSNTTYPYVTLASMSGNWQILSISGNASTIGTGNLIGWWKFDETTGTTAKDSSPSGINGTLSNGLTFSGCTITGAIGTALDFDGSDDYVLLTDNDFDFGTSDFTLSAWIKTSSTAALQTLFYKGASSNGTNGYWFYYQGGNFMRFYIEDTVSGRDGPLSSYTPDGIWHHFVATADRDGNATIYQNGIQVGAENISTEGNIDSTVILSIGARATGGLPFVGGLDDMRIYNKVLSIDEINDLYQLGAQ